jgi:hypothetical protein
MVSATRGAPMTLDASARVVSAVPHDHSMAPMRPIGETPERSSINPVGICITAWDQKNAANNRPNCCVSRPDVCWSCGAATNRLISSKQFT